MVMVNLEHTERTQLQAADVAQEYVFQAAKMIRLGKLNQMNMNILRQHFQALLATGIGSSHLCATILTSLYASTRGRLTSEFLCSFLKSKCTVKLCSPPRIYLMSESIILFSFARTASFCGQADILMEKKRIH